MLKSKLIAFRNLQNVPLKLKERYQGELTIIIVLGIFEDMASKLENN